MAASLLTATGRSALLDDIVAAGGPVGIGRSFPVLSLFPGVGNSTVAGLVARAFARSRAGRVLLVRAGAASSVMSGDDGTPGIPDVRGDGLPKAVRERLRIRDDVFVLDVPGADARTAGSRWRAAAVPSLRHFDVTIADWPSVDAPANVVEHATIGAAACLVTPNRRESAERTLLLADDLATRGVSPVVAFVDVERQRSTWPRFLERSGHRVVAFPYRTGRGVIASRRESRAASALAAELMRAAGDEDSERAAAVAKTRGGHA